MTVIVPTTADVMRGVADEIRRDPSIWTQGVLWRGEDGESVFSPGRAVCACSIGFLELAVYDSVDRFRRALNALGEVVGGDVAIWNDEEGRTAGEVADAFERAAKLLDVRSAT